MCEKDYNPLALYPVDHPYFWHKCKCEKAEQSPQTAEVSPSNSSDLLCCPWCGMAIEVKDKSDDSDQGEFYAYVCPKDSPCNNSRMVMGFFGTKADAIKFWNTRAI